MKPAVIASEQLFMFDVDETLIRHKKQVVETDEPIGINSPYEKTTEWVLPHRPHIKLLKNRHARGATIVVWSANGYRWAEAVVKALNLEPYVHFIMSKPQAYVDDLPAAEILGERMYLQPDSAWGNK